MCAPILTDPEFELDVLRAHLPQSRDGVLALEWWAEDGCVVVDSVDGMIRSYPRTRDEAQEMAAAIFGADREPHVLGDGGVLRWTHFHEDA